MSGGLARWRWPAWSRISTREARKRAARCRWDSGRRTALITGPLAGGLMADPGCVLHVGLRGCRGVLGPLYPKALDPSSGAGVAFLRCPRTGAGLPVAVFEYPVFKEDIASKDVSVVSLGDTILEERDSAGLVQLPPELLTRAAREMITILTTPEVYRNITAHNIAMGKRYFSFDVLRAHLDEALTWARLIECPKSR